MLKLHFVQHFPDGKVVVVTGSMLLAVLVGESALGVPTHQASVVVAQIFAGWVLQLGALGVVPINLVGIGREGDRLVRLEEPRGNGTEVHDRTVTLGGCEKVPGHGVDEGKVPGGFFRGGWFELRYTKPGIG